MLTANVSMVKTPKYATSESGDSSEVVERARGGLSVIVADGQGSGKSAKTTSTLVVNKVVSLIADGARDGAVARAAHDYLYAVRHGKVSATLTIISVDLLSNSILVSRNSHCPVIVSNSQGITVLDKPIAPIGVHRIMKPDIREFPLEEGTIIVTFTDGVMDAGKKRNMRMSIDDILYQIKGYAANEMNTLTDGFMKHCLDLDDGRPVDDTTIVAIGISNTCDETSIRRLDLEYAF